MIDISLKSGNGIDRIKRIKTRNDNICIGVWSMHRASPSTRNAPSGPERWAISWEINPMSIRLTSRASVPSDVLIQELQGESVLLNLRTGRYFGLDQVGTRMWMALTTAESLQAACDSLLSEYEVEGERLQQDLRHLVEELVGHGLVEVNSG